MYYGFLGSLIVAGIAYAFKPDTSYVVHFPFPPFSLALICDLSLMSDRSGILPTHVVFFFRNATKSKTEMQFEHLLTQVSIIGYKPGH